MRAFVFGLGFVGEAFARTLMARGWSMTATARSAEHVQALAAKGIEAVDPNDASALAQAMDGTQAILVTAPPSSSGCPGLAALAPAIGAANAFPDWIGYLSTTGVYGDREGGWVDERSALCAKSIEGARRVAAERDWRQTARGMGLTVATFRLPGIYGRGRSALDRVRAGDARRIYIPGHVFSRIHRDDVVSALVASIERPRPAAIYNIVDDEPGPQPDVLTHAADLLGAKAPPVTTEISEKAQRFYAESKRVSNALAKAELGWRPMHPDYRAGLRAILDEEQAA